VTKIDQFDYHEYELNRLLVRLYLTLLVIAVGAVGIDRNGVGKNSQFAINKAEDSVAEEEEPDEDS